MVRNAFWLVLIAGAAVAIAAGYVRASATTHPPPVAVLRAAAPMPPSGRTTPIGDRAIADAFAQDDVVVERTRDFQTQWQRAKLIAFVGNCGPSLAAVSGFFRLGVPIAFTLDPAAKQSPRIAQFAREAGDAVFVQVAGAPGPAAIAKLRRTLGSFDGVAGRDPNGMAAALVRSGLAYFDERGDADPSSFQTLGVPLVRRDVTVDDRSREGYVAFMLERASALSRRAGPVVVLLRPLPSSLAALREFVGTHDVQMVAFH